MPRTAIPRGFSLIEMTVVVVIVAILAGVGIARAGSGGSEYRARLAAQRVASDMELARRQSMCRATTVSIEFDAVNDRYTITGLYADGAATVVDLALPPYRVGLSSAALDGGGPLSYVGGVSSASGALELTLEGGGNLYDATVAADGGAAVVKSVSVAAAAALD